ncbi:Alkaline ceramidase 3 [Halotydeus destructor]|nr:Alkaline ceramidase 3 [Halotydeus destructor]
MAPSFEQFTDNSEHGYWGEPTSTIDWCERNYEVTLYIAEFWNSVSNLFFIVPPLVVFFKLWKQDVDRISLLALLYMAFTGIGSFAFHATLKYEMQLWDELGMVWSAIFVFCLIFRMVHPKYGSQVVLPTILYGIFANGVYLFLQTPIIFQLAYALLHYSVLYLSYKLLAVYPSDSRLYYGALIAHHVAFILWNIDNNLCGLLETIREALPTSCEPFTQLHAIWHFLAGYGSFALILFCIQAKLLSDNRQYLVSIDHMSGLTLQESNANNSFKDGRHTVFVAKQPDLYESKKK